MISKQFTKFIGVGIVCAILDIGLMQLLMSLGIYYFAATTVAFFIGFAANFLLHTNVTFSVDCSASAAARFAGVVLLNYVVTLLMVHLFQITLNMPLLGKLLSLPIVAINGFLLSKHWVYK